MGCVCCSLSSFISILLNALERISLCTVCALLTCCLLFTIITVMVIGVGIGYHYCFVQNSVESMAKAARAAGALRSGPETPLRSKGSNVMRSVDRAMQRGFAHRLGRREADSPPPSNNNDFFNDSSILDQNYNISYSKYNLSNLLPTLNHSIAEFVF